MTTTKLGLPRPVGTDNVTLANQQALIDAIDNNAAPINNAALTGVPTAPTAPTSSAGTQIANTGWVSDKVTGVNSALTAHLTDYTLQIPYAVATGIANTYAIATPITTLAAGMAVSVKINVASTGASTLNWDGKGAKGLRKSDGTSITNLKSNGIYTFRYDGTNFIAQGEGGGGNAVAADVLTGKTATVDSGDIVGTMPDLSVTKVVASNGVSWARRGATTVSDIVFKASAYSGKVAATTTYECGLVGAVPENLAAGVQFGDVNAGFIGTYTSDANATAAGMLAGQSGYVKGAKVSGTMPNNGTAVYYPATTNVPIANGYHAGSVVAAVGGNASAPQVLSGYVFSSAYGINQTGTMPVWTSDSPNPSLAGTMSQYVFMRPQRGYWDGSAGLAQYDPNFISSNIPAGTSMFGLAGTGVNAKRYASGTVVSQPSTLAGWIGQDGGSQPWPYIVVNGLNFPNGIDFININTNLSGGNVGTTFYSSKTLPTGIPGVRTNILMLGTGIKYAGPASVTTTGFLLTASYTSASFTWEAWGN